MGKKIKVRTAMNFIACESAWVTKAWYTWMLLWERLSRLYTRRSVDLKVRLRYVMALIADFVDCERVGDPSFLRLSSMASRVDMIASAVSIMNVQFLDGVSIHVHTAAFQIGRADTFEPREDP